MVILTKPCRQHGLVWVIRIVVDRDTPAWLQQHQQLRMRRPKTRSASVAGMDEVPLVAFPVHFKGITHPDSVVRVLGTGDVRIGDREECCLGGGPAGCPQAIPDPAGGPCGYHKPGDEQGGSSYENKWGHRLEGFPPAGWVNTGGSGPKCCR